MTRHTHDDGHLVSRPVDYDYVEHHDEADPGLLVIRGVPAEICVVCDEFWFDEEVGFGLARSIEQHRPQPGEVVTINWVEAHAA